MFLKRYGLEVKFVINYQMVCLEQMYIKFENFAFNYYLQEHNELIPIRQSLNAEHFRHFFFIFGYFTFSASE